MKNTENNLKKSKLIGTKTKPDLDDIELIELPPVDFGVHCRRHPSLQNTESSICKRNCKSKEKLISKTNDMEKKSQKQRGLLGEPKQTERSKCMKNRAMKKFAYI